MLGGPKDWSFLFTDIEGSTAAWEAHEEAMAVAVARHDDLVRAEIERHDGTVFGTAGDSFAAAFEDPADAVRAAASIQRALLGATWPEPVRIEVRVGVHTGPATQRGTDWFGPTVNVAARVADAGHGGQVVVSDATARLVGDRLSPLGPHVLKGVSDPVVLHQLDVPELDRRFPPLRAAVAGLFDVPVATMPIHGREDELAEVCHLLRTGRQVTVTGPGGTGKTRLAVALAEEIVHDVPGGVHYVDLTRATAAEEVAVGVIGAMRMVEPKELDPRSVAGLIADRPSLLVLDNCEHLVGAVADLVAEILAGGSHLRVLCTSRERLAIDGEVVLPLEPLPTGAGSPARRLFVERALAAHPGFSVEGDGGAIDELCERLDGLPLAIELAAARVGSLTPVELIEALDHRFELLRAPRSRGRSDGRATALEETIRWSYDLLQEDQQRWFRALGVFVGGFDVSAVAHVCGTDRFRAAEIVDELVGRSLVARADDSGGRRRFRLLETIRAYARSLLEGSGELDEAADRHAEHFSSVAPHEDFFVVTDFATAERLEVDWPNLAAAFERHAAMGRWDAAARLSTGATGCIQDRGHLFEGLEWYRRCLGQGDVLDREDRSWVTLNLVASSFITGRAGPEIPELLRWLRAEGSPTGQVFVRTFPHYLELAAPPALVDVDAVGRELMEALAICGDADGFARYWALGGIAFKHLQAFDHVATVAACDELLSVRPDLVDIWQVTGSEILAISHLIAGDPDAALDVLGLDVGTSLIANVHALRALCTLATGDVESARKQFEDVIDTALVLHRPASPVLACLAAAASIRGREQIAEERTLQMIARAGVQFGSLGRWTAVRQGFQARYLRCWAGEEQMERPTATSRELLARDAEDLAAFGL